MNAMQTALACEDLRFRYGGDSAEMRFDCAFAEGEITALVGPSGSGKSTLINLIAGFEIAASGVIRFGDSDITRAPVSERPVSMVFQENNLFSHMRIFDNVALGVAPSLRLTGEQRDSVEAALASVGLAGYGARLPGELSGGERQRVALARVIVRRKPILLLDEAFASLGPALRHEMLDLLSSIHDERRMTTVMVTHFPEDARRIAARTVFLADGAVVAEGPTGTLLDHDTAPEAVRSYLGRKAKQAG